jgi:hypothetical protein
VIERLQVPTLPPRHLKIHSRVISVTLTDNRSRRAKVGFNSCDVDDNFATIGKKQFNIVRAFDTQDFERARKLRSQFAIFVEEAKVTE